VADPAESAKKRILIADDEPSVLYCLRRVLGNRHNLIEAKDGQQAVVLAKEHRPDVIIMDMMMPVKDGLTACSEIRSNPLTSAIPIVMLTGVGYELNEKLAGAVGATRYVTKPFSPQELLNTIGSL